MPFREWFASKSFVVVRRAPMSNSILSYRSARLACRSLIAVVVSAAAVGCATADPPTANPAPAAAAATCNCGDASTGQNSTDASGEFPSTPQLANLSIVATSSVNVRLTWQPVQGCTVNIERHLQQSPEWDFAGTKDCAHGRFLDLGLRPEKTYLYRISTCVGDVCGDPVPLDPVVTQKRYAPTFEFIDGTEFDDRLFLFGSYSFSDLKTSHIMAVDRGGTLQWEYYSPDGGWVSETEPLLDRNQVAACMGPFFEIVDLDGTSLYSWSDSFVTQDINKMQDGRFDVIAYDMFQDPPGFDILGDQIQIINTSTPPNGAVDWFWRGRDHIPLTDVSPSDMANVMRGLGHDWTHANKLIFDEPTATMYFAVRNLDQIFAINYPNGDLQWVMGNNVDLAMPQSQYVGFGAGLWSHAHGLSFEPPNRFLMFDNGLKRAGTTEDTYYSRAIEIQFDASVPEAHITWQYPPDPKHSFYSADMGSVTRLDNNNILVSDGILGDLFEITQADNQVIWQISRSDSTVVVYTVHAVPWSFLKDW